MPFKKYLLTGLMVWLPLAITIWVLLWMTSVLDGLFGQLQAEARGAAGDEPDGGLGHRLVLKALLSAVIARSAATMQSRLPVRGTLDCFVEPVLGPVKPNPRARNDELVSYFV